MFNIFGTKAKKNAAANEQIIQNYYNRLDLERKSVHNLQEGPVIPEGFSAMEHLLSPAELKRAQNKAAAKVAANAKAAANAKVAELCLLCENGEKTLKGIHSLQDMEYYFNEVQPNMTFPRMRRVLQESPRHECVMKFFNAFNTLISEDAAYEQYRDYFQRSPSHANYIRQKESMPTAKELCIQRLTRQGYAYEQAEYLCNNGMTGGKKKRATRRTKRKSRSTRVKSRTN
jgi:hypothetical protein